VNQVDGIALRFVKWFMPHLDGLPTGTMVLIDRQALDRSLVRIKAGRAAFALTRGHGGAQIASSMDGCVSLTRRRDRLLLRVRPVGVIGRAAIRTVQMLAGVRELSIDLSQMHYIRVPGEFASIRVTSATITALAIVHRGACAGCRLHFAA
jgi:hypothetical protein